MVLYANVGVSTTLSDTEDVTHLNKARAIYQIVVKMGAGLLEARSEEPSPCAVGI